MTNNNNLSSPDPEENTSEDTGADKRSSALYDAINQAIADIAISLSEGPLPLLQPDDVAHLVAERDERREQLVADALASGGYRNPNVPWDDAYIPYECECGRITYSDSPCDCPNSHYGPYAD